MATLYITDTGFRFPYDRWSARSSEQNLKFLEAQLDEYLHSHENDAVAKKLWVTKRGFRPPERRGRWTLDDNMKFIERQLEEYLHEHETQASEPEGSQELEGLRDVGFENTTSIPTVGTITGFNPIVWTADQEDLYVSPWVKHTSDAGGTIALSTANPRTGSKHARFTGTFQSNDGIWATAEYPGELADLDGPVASEHIPGFAAVLEGYFAWSAGTFPGLRLTILTLDATGDVLNTQTTSLNRLNLTSSYQRFTAVASTNINTAYLSATVQAVGGNSITVDMDDFSLTVRETVPGALGALATRKTGFRFPYQDYDSPGSLDINMKFLETQISQYLHSHEVGI